MADIDGDDTDDIITGSYSPGSIYWFKGKAGRTFDDRKVLVEAKRDESNVSRLCASAVSVVDWDKDGLLDLIVGNIEGEVLFLKNTGTKTKPAFGEPVALRAGGAPLSVSGDAGPCVVDWDGDGVLDVIVGDGQHGLTFFKGEKGEKGPTLAKGVPIQRVATTSRSRERSG